MTQERTLNQMVEIEINKLTPVALNVRTEVGDLTELTASIREIGVKQPILVRETEDEYQIFAGFRRYEASKLAGKDSIPAVIYSADEISDVDMLAINMVENIQRSDLNIVDEAHGYTELKRQFKLTNKQVADRVGVSVARIRERLNILKMSDVIQEALYQDRISLRAAKEIERLPMDLQGKYVQLAADLHGERFEKMIDRELARIEKKQSKSDGEEEPKDPDKREVTGLVRRLKKRIGAIAPSAGIGDATRLKDVNWRALAESDIDDLREVVSFFDSVGEILPMEVEINEKAQEEIVATVEGRLLLLDLDNPEVRQGLIQMIVQRTKERAVENATKTGKRPRISYVLAKEVLNHFYVSRRDVVNSSK